MRKTITFFRKMFLIVILSVVTGSVFSETITITGADMTTTDGAQSITKSGVGFNGFMKQYQTTKIWFTSGTGYIYNTTSLGSITKITLSYNSGGSSSAVQRFNVGTTIMSSYMSSGGTTVSTSTGGTTYNYTGGVGKGFFNISVSSKNLQLVSLVIEYTPEQSCTTPSFSFASSTVNKVSTDAAFTNTFTSDNTSTKVWSSTNEAVATVNSSGLVTIAGAGSTNIKVNQVEDGTYCAVVDASYTLNVTNASAPAISVTETISPFSANVNSSSQSTIHVNASNLTGDITLALSGTNQAMFSLDKTSISPTSGSVTDEVVTITYSPTAAGSHSATLTLSSAGATDVTESLTGTAVYAEPTNQPTGLTATANSSSQITVTWTDASGTQAPTGYLVKATVDPSSPTAPVDGTAEIDGTLVKNITQGTQQAVFTGLSGSTTYNFSIWPYTNSGSSINYKIGSEPTTSATTLVQPWTEDFETGTKASYTAGDLTSTKGSWNISEGLIGTSASDRKNGAQSVRLRYTSASVFGELKMNFDKPTGAGTVTVNHAVYGTNVSGSWKLQMSINGGIDWIDIGSTINTTSTTLTAQNFTINQSGNVRFKIIQLSGDRISIDDIAITDCSAPATSVWTGSTSTDWNLTYNWSNGNPDNTTEVTIPDVTNDPIINSNSTVSSLNLNTGSILSVNAGKYLTVSTTLINNGTLNLLSTADGTATIKTGTVSGSGTTNVQQYLPGDGRSWWYLSSPVTGATSTLFGSDKVGQYDEATTSYSSPFSTATNLVAGTGYVVKRAVTTAGTYTFAGTLNNGDITLNPTRTGTTAGKRGFNLIGNPYPSYLDWNAAYADAATSNIRNAIWYRTYSGGQMTFHTYADADGVPEITTGIIPPAQAFWIRVNADGSNGAITFKNTHRSHAGATANPLKAPKINDRPRVRLQVSNGVNTDEALIVAKSYASNGIDNYDIEKMSNSNVEIPEIYSLLNNQEMVINSLNGFIAGQQIALGFRPGKAGEFTISSTQFESVPSEVKVVLKDQLTGVETELNDGVSYSFSSDATTTDNRFVVSFRAPGTTTGTDIIGDASLQVYAQASEIVITSAALTGSSISVFSATGQRLFSGLANNNREVVTGNFTSGVYFVKVNAVVKKVSVK